MAFDLINNTDTVLSSGLQSGSSSPTSAFALGGATFKTEQATVDLTRQVRYSLVNPNIPVSKNPGDPATPNQTLTFPVSPQSLLITRGSLVNWFEAQGTPNNTGVVGGVMRLVDLYGITPVTFTIKGTTGYNKYYADGFLKTGTQWMTALQTFIMQYFINLQKNPTQPNDMQFLDYWYQEYWHVVPAGPVRISQDASRPLWMFYELTLIGLTELKGAALASAQKTVTSSLPSAKSNMANLQQVMAGVLTGAALLGPYI